MKNKYFERNGCMVGVTKSGVEFYFDKADYKRVSEHTWCTANVHGLIYVATRVVDNGKPKELSLHRFIVGKHDGFEIDHINHNTLDNRRENLRVASHRENMRNRVNHKQGSSIYKGVSFYKPLGKWRAQIRAEGKKKYLGYFENEVDAARAYNSAAKKYFGSFAYLNTV